MVPHSAAAGLLKSRSAASHPCSYTLAAGTGAVGAALFIGGFVVKSLQED